ncbi:extracellular solute-binding protein [Amphritea sp. 1_MG-2023]|uniref:extracellular solute-binding protein n=1 Tax=Amphritea sp. 1_MG-2023 TaxID=3062670 RepID=UPI0026E12B7C|nr:extracellular solute-binding protein [Amphritea sp. 1_MG-2023]MDO6564133.1 extracellular solute-binding protein [Amphritea sp. 1_MG-2023]
MKYLPQTLAIILATTLVTPLQAAQELMIYSTKNASYLTPLLDRYSAETGTPVSYLIEPASALIARLETEGTQSKADILLTSSAASLWQATQKGLTTAVDSNTLTDIIPAHLRSPDNHWFGFSKRTQTLIYNSAVLDKQQLKGYEDLADPKWEGNLCLRTAQQAYTQSLVAMLINRDGEQKTLATLQGWVYNQAVRPFAEDSHIFPAMEQNICDVSIVNSYYFARYKHDNPDTPLKLFWADQDSSGVHVDITGAAVTAHSDNKAGATDLLEWLVLKEAQAQYAKLSHEYPVNKKVYPVREVGRRGKYSEDQHNLSASGRYQAQAVVLLKQAGYR